MAEGGRLGRAECSLAVTCYAAIYIAVPCRSAGGMANYARGLQLFSMSLADHR